MRTIADVYPVLGLCITEGNLQLRGLTDSDLVALGELAQRGVHPPERMPFYHAWTDAPVEQIPLSVAQYHWNERASFSAARFSLDLGVWVDGELVGSQGFGASDFRVTRTGETGSWLGQAHQGRGIGTRMRQAMCAFLFDHLNAVEITSGAYLDNAASIAVSRKVGYVENGVSRKVRRGTEVADHVAFRLTRESFVSGEPIAVDGVAPLRVSIGLGA